MMPVEEIKLTASFRVDLTDIDEAAISEMHRLFKEYQRIMNELIEHAHSHRTTSFISLHHAKCRELRQRHPTLPSHYIDMACRHAASIYKSFIELKKMGVCEKEKPVFKRWTIWLDDHLFKLDVEGWRASSASMRRIWAPRSLMEEYIDGVIGVFSGYWSIRRNSADYM
jgi:putative transposase